MHQLQGTGCVSVWSSAGGRILRGGDVVKKSGLPRALTSRQAQPPRILLNYFFFLYHCP